MPQRFPTIELDAHIVMPNHFHAIVVIAAPLVGAPDRAEASIRDAPTANPSLGDVIGAFKSVTTNEYIIRQYIHENPARWAADTENPDRKGDAPHG